MAVSSVSPPPAESTEGADLCGIDVTNTAIHGVMLLTCLCGLVGNGAVLWLLTLQGPVARIFDLAVADFIFLVFALPSALLFLLEDMSCSPIMHQVYVSFLFQLSMMSYYWGLFRLTRITVIPDTHKLCLLFFRCHPPLRLLWVVDSAVYWVAFAVITAIPTVTFLCPLHEQEHCRVALTSTFAITLLIFAAPVVVIRTMDIIKAKRGSQQQKLKKRDTVIFLIVLFILILNLWNILQQLCYTGVSSQVFFLLACITSTIKPFIYFLVGRCWKPCSLGSLRLALQRVFEEQKDITPTNKDTTRDMEV